MQIDTAIVALLKLVNNHDSKRPIEAITTKTVHGAFINYVDQILPNSDPTLLERSKMNIL